MLWLWYADRTSGMLAYVVLVASAFTGIAYNATSFGWVHRLSRGIHTPVSWAALVTLLAHGGLGAVDTLLVVDGEAPAPNSGIPFLVAGVAVGLAALVVTIVATLAFLDPRRFERPWRPGVVHAFAYGGFAAATLHAVAVGTDIRTFAVDGLAAIGFLLALTVALRRRAKTKEPTPTPRRLARSAPSFRAAPMPTRPARPAAPTTRGPPPSPPRPR